MASPEAAARALLEVARLGEEYGSRLDGAYRLLDEGALVGPAAYALFTGMSEQHRAVRNAFLDAFDQVHRLARRAQPPTSVKPPYLRHPPLGLVPAAKGVLSGSPEQLNLLAGELTRTGRGWEEAGKILGGILGNLGLSRGPGMTIGRAGAWAVSEKRDLDRRRNELLKSDEGGVFTKVVQGPLDAVMMATLAERDPALAARLEGAGVNLSQIPTGSATDVNTWWKTLTAEQRVLYIQAFPSRIGWTNGVPSADRDKANRLTLTTRLAELQGKPAGRLTIFEQRDLRRLKKLDLKLRAIAADGKPVYLLGFDSTTAGPWDGYGQQGGPLAGELPKIVVDGTPGPDGRVIVAIGNPDTAAHTGVYVPGTTTQLDTIAGDIDRAENLYSRGQRYSPGQVSVITWLGYDAPDAIVKDAPVDKYASVGAPELDGFVKGLRAVQGQGHRHLTAIGHSYGSTVIGVAAKGGGLHVDDIIVAGSPGMHVPHARDLHIDPDHVWAEKAEGDPVPDIGRWGHGRPDRAADPLYPLVPSDPEFGGHHLTTDTHGHSAYWDLNTKSLENQAKVLTQTNQNADPSDDPELQDPPRVARN
ncbi:alpha/beta hydrolase [Actinomadura scrupuli]|uniref:alpha/beta hydrolase n=1 Tax=Actinomadura scrupuli TaxID=559629 RepID=UPI003D999C47